MIGKFFELPIIERILHKIAKAILADEQRRGLYNVLNGNNVINVRFCSIIGKLA